MEMVYIQDWQAMRSKVMRIHLFDDEQQDRELRRNIHGLGDDKETH
jgi:hypothetical protein